MKRQGFWIVLLSTVLALSGCSGSGGSDTTDYSGTNQTDTAMQESKSAGLASNGDNMSGDGYSDESGGTGEDGQTSASAEPEQKSGGIDLQKIIYSGQVTVYTDKFQETLTSLDKLIGENKGFVEHSEFRDDDAYNGYSENYRSRYYYTATIRVPSDKFHSVMDSVSGLGKASNKSTNADNVTAEYNDNKAVLEVYETQRDRYMEQLKKTKDENVALQLQSKIMDLDTKIASYKSRLQTIDNMVDYSTITVTVQEYAAYEESEKEDTFFDKLKDIISEAGESIQEIALFVVQFITVYLLRIIVGAVAIILVIKLIIFILRLFGIMKPKDKNGKGIGNPFKKKKGKEQLPLQETVQMKEHDEPSEKNKL